MTDEQSQESEAQGSGSPENAGEEKIRQKDEEIKKIQAMKEELEKELNRTRSDLSVKERDLRDFETRCKNLEEKFEKVKQPPLIYAYIGRKDGDDLSDHEVVVIRGSDMLKVSTGETPKTNLKLGQYVWLHPQTYAIIGKTSIMHQGVIAKVFDILENKMILQFEESGEKRVIDFPRDFDEPMKPGYLLAVLPPTMEIMDILPNYEVKNLFLGEKPNVQYLRIGGLDDAIERIKDVIVLPYKEPELFLKVKLTPPKGILMYGPPGCGKTLLAKAVASEHEMTFFNISVADILSKWVGESERIIKELFRQAKERKPSIVFFDEIEALFTTRGRLDTSGVHKNIIGQILAEMDGIVALEDVYVIGATNRPDLLDPALMRPGRFDEIIEINRPDRKAGDAILGVYLTNDLPVTQDLLSKHGSQEAAIQALKKFVVDELYGEKKWIEIKVDPEAKDSVKTVKRKDIISGAIIEAIVKTAKKNYIKRVMEKSSDERAKDGLTREDFKLAIEEECKEHALTEMYVIKKRQREILKMSDEDPMVG
jgi:proteasome-associated ATPase